MTSQILGKDRSGSAGAAPEIAVAAFGKHPAWNDFIDDLGLDTERLIAVKRVLFLEGIGAAIESGSWDKLDAAKRTEGFHHLFLWRNKGDLVIGRLWSSSDGKGRTKYPMVVVAHCKGASLAWVLVEVLPRLERLERRCRDATTQEQVSAALDATRTELRTRAAVAEPGGPIQPGAIAEVETDLDAAGSREPFYRLMYQVERDWAAYLVRRPDSASSTRTWTGGVRPQHARVPVGRGTTEEILRRWLHFVLNLVDTATPVTLIASTDPAARTAAWLDLVIGEPDGAQFFCIRASEETIPLATEIPYTLDPEHTARCDRLLTDVKEGRTAPAASESKPEVRSGLLGRVSAMLGGKKKGLLILAIGVGLVGAGLLIVGAFSGPPTPTNEPEKIAASSSEQRAPPKASQTQTPPAPAPSAGSTEWARLCAAYHDWFSQFIDRLQKRATDGPAASYATRGDYYSTDAHLRSLVERLRALETGGRMIDPWAIAGVPKSTDLADLAKNPPASLNEDTARQRIAEANAVIDGFSSRLAADWPLAGDAVAAASSLETSGLVKEAGFLRSLVPNPRAKTAAELDAGIETLLGASRVVEDLEQRLAIKDECAKAAAATGDPVLAGFSKWADATMLRAAGPVDLAAVEALSRSLAPVVEVATPLRKFIDESWSSTDKAVLGRRIAAAPGVEAAAPTRDSFVTWVRLARESPSLDPDTDPRRASTARDLLAQVQTARGRLESDLKAAPAPRLVEIQSGAAAALKELDDLPFNAQTQTRIAEALPRIESQLREAKQGFENAIAVETARRAGSAKEVRDGLTAQATIVSRSDAVNTTWREQRDKLLASHTDAEYAQLRVKADRLRELLTSLDEAVPPGLEASGLPGWESDIVQESWAMREQLLASTLKGWGGMHADEDGSLLSAARDRISADFARTRQSLSTLATDLRKLEGLLRDGDSLSQSGPDGDSIAALAARGRASDLLRNERLAAAVRPVLVEVDALEKVEAMHSAAELLAGARAALPDRWALALASWRRLGSLVGAAGQGASEPPAWPATIDDLAAELDLATHLRAAVVAGAGTRRAALETEIAQQLAARWTRCFARLRDAGAIEAAAAMAQEFGADPGSLPPVPRYNFMLATLRRDALGTPLTDELAREKAARFEAGVEGLGSDIASRGQVAPLLTALAPISGKGAPPVPTIDVTTLGPGSLAGAGGGWKGTLDGPVLRFTRAAGAPLTLEFHRVDAPGIEPFFIGSTEVSLGAATELLDGADAWRDLASLFSNTDPGEDFRRGPRVWRWTEDPKKGPIMRPATKWLRELATGRSVSDTPAGMSVPPPGPGSPMNYVSPAAALFIAQLAGCRLPTEAEWTAALSLSHPERDLQKANLRDQTWKREQDHVAEIARSGTVSWPDADVFLPLPGAGLAERPRTGREGVARDWDDGVLWFAEVDRAPAGQTSPLHLVGNVAEYVLTGDGLGAMAAPGVPPSPGAIRDRLRQASAVEVIGASALSPVELEPTRGYPVELAEAVDGFADVGFRMAFNAKGLGPMVEPLGVQLAKVLADRPYLRDGE